MSDGSQDHQGVIFNYSGQPLLWVIGTFLMLLIPSIARGVFILEPFAIWLLPHADDVLVSYVIVPWYLLLATSWAYFICWGMGRSGADGSFLRFWKVFVILYAIFTLPIAVIGPQKLLRHNYLPVLLTIKIPQMIAIAFIVRALYGLRWKKAIGACIIGCLLQGALMGAIYFLNGYYMTYHSNQFLTFATARAMNARTTPR